MKIRNIVSFILVLALSAAIPSCDNGCKTEFEILRDYTADWLTTAPGAIRADDVYADITGNDYFNVIDVRSDANWTNTGRVDGIDGHVVYTNIMDNLNLFTTDTSNVAYPNVVHCVTGNTGAVAMVGLNLVGYPTRNMKYGMMGWNSTVKARDPLLEGQEADDSAGTEIYFTTVETTATADNHVPFLITGKRDAQAIAEARYRAYTAGQASSFDFTISPVDVLAIVDGTHATLTMNDVQIISVRSASVYAAGHIKGAINIPWKEIANPDQIRKLDPTKTILIYCFTGHTGAQATAVLNLLGYHARNIKYGMEGLTTDDTLLGTSRFTDDVDFPITTDHI